MIEQLSFFAYEKSEEQKVLEETADFFINHRMKYQTMTAAELINDLQKYVNSGGSFINKWQIAFWHSSCDVILFEPEFKKYTFSYKTIAKTILERR